MRGVVEQARGAFVKAETKRAAGAALFATSWLWLLLIASAGPRMGRFGAGLISQAEFKILPMEEDLGQCVFAVIRLLRGVTVGPILFADGIYLRWPRNFVCLAH